MKHGKEYVVSRKSAGGGNMDSVLFMSIFWIIYGILGIFFGIQVIPKKYKGSPYEREYKKNRGISWILLGIPYLIIDILAVNTSMERNQVVMLLIVCSIPSLVFDFWSQRKYQ